jgi:hypothetical protein
MFSGKCQTLRVGTASDGRGFEEGTAEGRRRVLRLLTAKNKKGREIQQG